MTEAAIDVLIPIFNAAATVEDAVRSIQQQTVRDLTIFLLDDGSTDETPQILAGIARADPRVRVITKANGGIVEVLNLGLAQCTAEFIARQDADDLSSPTRLEAQIRYLTEHPECVAVSGSARLIDRQGKPTGGLAIFPPPDSADPIWVPSREPYLLHPFLLVRRSAIQAVGGYRHVLHAEDTDLYWRLAEIGALHSSIEVMGDYRYHAQSVTSRSIHNGRLSALNSQLAAISASRRRAGRADLSFEGVTVDASRGASSASDMLAVAGRELTEPEGRYLRTAFAAKLLELTAYRPYELDREDCRFVASALEGAELAPANWREVRHLRAIATARLILKGRFASARTLLSRRTLGETMLRLGWQGLEMALPARVRRSIAAFRAARATLRPGSTAASPADQAATRGSGPT